jgi:predicted ATP-binding protein involved in virulence
MGEVFISEINIRDLRNIKDLKIFLSSSEAVNLILTGKNGSGKSTLVAELYRELKIRKEKNHSRSKCATLISSHANAPNYNPFFKVATIDEYINLSEVILIYFPAISKYPTDKKIEVLSVDVIEEFIDMMNQLNYNRLHFKDKGENEQANRISQWFDNFENSLRQIFDMPALKFVADPPNRSFKIRFTNDSEIDFREMSDGYDSLLYMIMKITLEMNFLSKQYDDYMLSGIVFVDEMETHMDVRLQKQILPMLTRMFPNVQFIVTTHSPFIVTALENSVVFNLDKRERLDNPSSFSYGNIVESFFDSDQYSETIKRKLARYKELIDIPANILSEEQRDEFIELKIDLELVSPAAKTLYLQFKELERQRRGKKFG